MKLSVRNDYLRAMGISQWLPKHPLENAGQSADFVTELIAQIQIGGIESATVTQPSAVQLLADSDSAGSEIDSKTKLGAASSLIQGPTPNQVKHQTTPTTLDHSTASLEPSINLVSEQPTASPVETNIQIAANTEIPRFAFHILPMTEQITWVFDADLDQRLIGTFCHRVKQAFNVDSGFHPQTSYFGWPFIESNQHDQSAAVAKQALAAQWHFMKEQGCSSLVLWGPQCNRWFKEIDANIIFSMPGPELRLQADIKSSLWKCLRSYLKST